MFDLYLAFNKKTFSVPERRRVFETFNSLLAAQKFPARIELDAQSTDIDHDLSASVKTYAKFKILGRQIIEGAAFAPLVEQAARNHGYKSINLDSLGYGYEILTV